MARQKKKKKKKRPAATVERLYNEMLGASEIRYTGQFVVKFAQLTNRDRITPTLYI